MRPPLIAATLVLLAGCSQAPRFIEYREPSGEFSAQVPKGWTLDERGPFSRKPIGEVWWIGTVVDQHEGSAVGAMLLVRKLDRHPDKKQASFIKEVLGATDALFSGTHPKDILVQALDFSGQPARAFTRDYEETTGGGIHGETRVHPVRVTGLVIQTHDAYYVLEYRAVRDQFDKYFPAFERLRSSFKILR